MDPEGASAFDVAGSGSIPRKINEGQKMRQTASKVLRRRCEELLQKVQLPKTFSVETLCDTLATRSGRPILLSPISTSGVMSGAWVPTRFGDVVFFDRSATGVRREQVILHEVAHILFGHEGRELSDMDVASLLLYDMDPAVLKAVVQRGIYSSQEEQEAEMLASMLLEHKVDEAPRSVTDESPAATALRRRVALWLERGTASD